MKLDLGTQSFMQNTFSIFSLTIFNLYIYIFLQIEWTIIMVIEQITSIRWLTME